MIPESDPSGKNPHSPGAKLDAGKTRLGLVLLGFSRALQAVGEVGTFGARKYTEDGWLEVENGQARYTDALLRHLMSEARGEKLDSDSGLRHAAQVAWNALARLDIRSEEIIHKSAPEIMRAEIQPPIPWTGGILPYAHPNKWPIPPVTQKAADNETH
jgi:hypothetical protein